MKKYTLILSLSFLLISTNVFGATSILGYWLTGGSIVQIEKCNDYVCGKIKTIFVEEGVDPKQLLDEKNKDKSLRSRTLVGINVLDNSDKNDFKKFVYNKNSFNPHIMFITKPEIMDKWFSQLFSWLKRCEEEYRFKKLTGYDTTRLYAYLAERYLSFWFKKYTKYLENPWIFLDY
mgnify:CR=1 FL=1